DREAAPQNPGTPLLSFFTRVVDQAPTKLAFVDALAVAGVDVIQHATASPVGQELLGAITTLLTRAQRAGTVRDDIGVTELIALLIGTSRAVEHAGFDSDVQARILAVV